MSVLVNGGEHAIAKSLIPGSGAVKAADVALTPGGLGPKVKKAAKVPPNGATAPAQGAGSAAVTAKVNPPTTLGKSAFGVHL